MSIQNIESIGATTPVAPVTNTPSTSRVNKAVSVAKKRNAKLKLAERGKALPAGVSVDLDEDTLLDDVTRAAEDFQRASGTLRQCVEACCEMEIDRDTVIDAVVAGGVTLDYARSLVSNVYCAKGKRVKAKGQGRQTPIEATFIAEYAVEKYPDYADAIKFTRAALRYLVAQKKQRDEKAKDKANAKPIVGLVEKQAATPAAPALPASKS